MLSTTRALQSQKKRPTINVGTVETEKAPDLSSPNRLAAGCADREDITLSALCDRLWCERGVKADTSMMSRFFRRIGVTLKKRPSSRASKIVRT